MIHGYESLQACALDDAAPINPVAAGSGRNKSSSGSANRSCSRRLTISRSLQESGYDCEPVCIPSRSRAATLTASVISPAITRSTACFNGSFTS